MAKRHLFSLNAPKNWPIERKKYTWITRPSPGPHKLEKCLPLNLLIKHLLKYSRTARETRTILNSGEILVDNKIRKDQKFPIGIMDTIHVKKTKENFRLIVNQDNKYELKKITEAESKLKPCRIINKKTLKKGKVQLNLFDGRNILVDKDIYKVGDTVIFDLEKNKIVDHLKLDKGAMVYILDGKYIGHIGKVNDIVNETGFKANKILFSVNKEKYETLKDYAFVIPEELNKK